MKNNLLKVSSLSILAVLCTANAWGLPHPACCGVGEIVDCDFGGSIDCPQGYYCEGGDEFLSVDFSYSDVEGMKQDAAECGGQCPSNYDNTATGLKSIEECCLNGYDSSTGLCKAAGPTLYNDTISESCKVDFLGASSGNALNSFLAEYTPNTYTVSLHSNYGTDTVLGTVTATYDAAMPTASAPARVGYTFGGFYDATTSGTQYYTSTMASAKNYDKTSNANLYAYWDVNSHTITFSCGTMTGTIPNGTATYDSSYTFPTDSACEHTGYTFNGWGCSNDTTYTSGQSLTWNVDSDLTCNAQWTANTITISWDPNNGNPASTNQCTYDGDITLPTAPTKTGYEFSGWKLIIAPSRPNCPSVPYEQCDSTPGCRTHGDSADKECYYASENDSCSGFTDQESCDGGMTSCNACSWQNGSCVGSGRGWLC